MSGTQGSGFEKVEPERLDAMSEWIRLLEEQLEEEREARSRLERRVDELEQALGNIGASERTPNSPDERALKIRAWLYDEAQNSKNGTAKLDKEVAKGVLGNIQRNQRYEAMRRAAGGDELADQGSSSLRPKQGYEFDEFGRNDERNTRVRINLDQVESPPKTDWNEKEGESGV